MELVFKAAQDFRGWAGISFDIGCDHPYPGSDIRLEIVMPGRLGVIEPDARKNPNYRVEKPVSVFNGRAAFLFQEMHRQDWSEEPPCGYLDLQQVFSVAVICNTTCSDVEFYVDNFALVKSADIPS